MEYFGSIEKNFVVSDKYKEIAIEDEKVAILLHQNGQYKHAMYYYIQAMEKYIRSKIFTYVNPEIQYYRERNRDHSLENAIEFLIEIIHSDQNIRNQISHQLNEHVLGNVRYQQLHNNLRYPFYNNKRNEYQVINFTRQDCDLLSTKLNSLKIFLNDLDKFRL